ncbi:MULTISPECIES: GNAT family N-acetyltransferase [Agrobacterium]|uniref:GNAT family N-acetyltransferase n=1 Tax=Agrobacterium tumefaciens TaxID=358 RepID=A0AAE6BH50_AGRTU|nr:MULTISPECIES: GNAT family N-acetyltransferase [Agrobacterium]QCL77002.1 GNAT family N-acetyltransferase [Agrobacterium tumefaciens]QCL82509.1 GNAT family N-acetyltransferase [Agrobacterium tumefaciens]CUX70973.1 Sortase-like acyltransferase [Agrobacterium sp. NCPPB 925]
METSSWQIRTISPGEVDVFRQIRLEALQSEPGAFASVYEDWVGLSDAEWRERMNIPVFVAFAERRPVGLMALKQLHQPKMIHRATITMVYVNQRFRSSGLANALLDTTIRYAQQHGMRQIELGVRANRAGAIRFYKRAGFREIGTVPQGYVDDGLEFDEILMAKRLDAKTCL